MEIHELTHMLGFIKDLYGSYYMGPDSTVLRKYEEVVRSVNGKTYIITPKVK